MTFLHAVVDWDGELYICPFFEHRKKVHSFGNIGKGGFFENWFTNEHLCSFDRIDPLSCVPNCPMRRYNPLVEYIKAENYRFGFI